MTNAGMDGEVFEQFIAQLQRYVKERLIPSEREIAETNRLPDGTKRYITNAPFAKMGLIMARTSKENMPKYDAERFFRDARIYRIYEGTTQILQLQIAKHMLRKFSAAA